MRILFASRYVDPDDLRANKVILKQASILSNLLDIEILTWPKDDYWSGDLPNDCPTLHPLKVKRNDLSFNVIVCPLEWNEVCSGNSISDKDWNDAVSYGIELLKLIKPDILHLHHRMGFWWLLESAQILSIPTVYTNYDFGIACLRTTLLTGDGELCDGKLSPKTCSICIKKGRKSFLGIMNEKLVESNFFSKLFIYLDKLKFFAKYNMAFSILKSSALERTTRHQKRLRSVMSKLDYLITPSEFGSDFFHGLGVRKDKILVIPWFHEVINNSLNKKFDKSFFTITYFGRVSPEKGVHLIFEALEQLSHLPTMKLIINGADESNYCLKLINKYNNSVNNHIVEWNSWSPIEGSMLKTDVTIIPSTVMDNTPLTLVESIVYKTPFIASDIPTFRDLVNKDSAYLADFNSSKSLANQIENAFLNISKIRSNQISFPKINSPLEYCQQIVQVYKKVKK